MTFGNNSCNPTPKSRPSSAFFLLCLYFNNKGHDKERRLVLADNSTNYHKAHRHAPIAANYFFEKKIKDNNLGWLSPPIHTETFIENMWGVIHRKKSVVNLVAAKNITKAKWPIKPLVTPGQNVVCIKCKILLWRNQRMHKISYNS